MDFPITEHEVSLRHTAGNTAGRGVSDSQFGSFADLLSSDMFFDASEGAAPDEIYDELETLTERDDRADEEPS